MRYLMAILLLFAGTVSAQDMPGQLSPACVVPASITGTLTASTGGASTLSDSTPGGEWYSSAVGVATVSMGGGVVSGIATGTTTITYQTGPSCMATATFTVAGPSYATWSTTNRAGTCALSNNNLTMKTNVSGGTGAYGVMIATVGRTTGKYYWEVAIDQKSVSSEMAGIANYLPGNMDNNVCGQVAKSVGFRGTPWCISYYFTSFTTQGANCGTYGAGDVLGFAFDLGAGTIAIYKNNTLLGTVTGIPSSTWYPACNATNTANDGVTARFDPAQMTYSAPSGFTAGW